MANATSKSLRPTMTPGLSELFFRVRPRPVTWNLSRGLGLVFPICWSGERTMLHLVGDTCPHCNKQTVAADVDFPPPLARKLLEWPLDSKTYESWTRVGSLHCVRDQSTTSFGNLFLPSRPTRHLLAIDPAEIGDNIITMTTARRGPGSGKVEADIEVRPRTRPLDEDKRAKVVAHLMRQIIRYFGGLLRGDDAVHMIRSWPSDCLSLD